MPESVKPDIDAATAAIGARLANVRVARGMKVSELARRAGVSSSLISQIERGTSKPSVGTLFAVARVLDTSIDSFFSDITDAGRAPSDGITAVNADSEDQGSILDRIRDIRTGRIQAWHSPNGAEREVVRADERARLDIRGGVRWERLTATPLDGLEFMELIYGPGAESDSQAYRHPGVELVLVTSGQMTIFLGFNQHDLYPGDSIAFASSIPHRYVNRTDTETRAVTVILRDDLSTLAIREEPSPEVAEQSPAPGDDDAQPGS